VLYYDLSFVGLRAVKPLPGFKDLLLHFHHQRHHRKCRLTRNAE
jgi:hypothetical protein